MAPWKDSVERPVIYHCVTRVVDRRFAFEQEDKEKFRTYMLSLIHISEPTRPY